MDDRLSRPTTMGSVLESASAIDLCRVTSMGGNKGKGRPASIIIETESCKPNVQGLLTRLMGSTPQVIGIEVRIHLWKLKSKPGLAALHRCAESGSSSLHPSSEPNIFSVYEKPNNKHTISPMRKKHPATGMRACFTPRFTPLKPQRRLRMIKKAATKAAGAPM